MSLDAKENGCYLRIELETRDAAQIAEIRTKLTEAGFHLIDKNNTVHYKKNKLLHYPKAGGNMQQFFYVLIYL